MKTVGLVTTVMSAAVVATAVVIGVRSIPDIKRYMQMRRM